MKFPGDALEKEVPLRLAEPVTGLQGPKCGTVVGQGGDAGRRHPNDVCAEVVVFGGAKCGRRNLAKDVSIAIRLAAEQRAVRSP